MIFLAFSEFIPVFSLYFAHLSFRRTCTRDYRTRRDRTERRNQAFLKQMPAIVDSYMAWSLAVGEGGIGGDYSPPDGIESQGQSNIMEMDMFRELYLLLFLLRTRIEYSNCRLSTSHPLSPPNRQICVHCNYSPWPYPMCTLYANICLHYPRFGVLPNCTQSLSTSIHPRICQNLMRFVLRSLQIAPFTPILNKF